MLSWAAQQSIWILLIRRIWSAEQTSDSLFKNKMAEHNQPPMDLSHHSYVKLLATDIHTLRQKEARLKGRKAVGHLTKVNLYIREQTAMDKLPKGNLSKAQNGRYGIWGPAVLGVAATRATSPRRAGKVSHRSNDPESSRGIHS